MTELQNSAFKEKASRVEDVSKILPEVGAVVLNNLDGRLYAADQFGWHRFGDPYSIINLFVDFNGTDQFAFRFRLPSTKSIVIDEGDGTLTEITGQDDTWIDHDSTYTTPGVYIFTVLGDYLDIYGLSLPGSDALSGSIQGYAELKSLATLSIAAAHMYGDANKIFANPNTVAITINYALLVTGDAAYRAGTAIINNSLGLTNIHGDLSTLAAASVAGTSAVFLDSKVTFDRVTSWTLNSSFLAQNCNWTHAMVDNALISFANGTTLSKTINLGGNNAGRTSRSDAAYDQLIAAGCTITVN